MDFNKEVFKEKFKNRLDEKYALDVKDATPQELYLTLSSIVRSSYSRYWRKTWKKYMEDGKKQIYYFSIEFLPGRLLMSNLLNMGWLETVRDALKDLDIDLDEIAEVEKDMALGNGGLGRLASAFMDSLASDGLPGNGNGIRYRYGLFKQKFIDGYQIELPNEWLDSGNPWEIRRESKSVTVRLGGKVYLVDRGSYLEPVYEGAQLIKAVPYDTAIVGYKNGTVNTMRLWDAEIPSSEETKYRTIEQRREVEDLVSVLYPDDSKESGRILRLKQEYFFVSAGIQSIVRHFKKYNKSMNKIGEYIGIHINDTHPAMSVAELMRILVDEEHMSWDDAWKQTVAVMSYTNHTIMAEALEKWPVHIMQQVQPRILQIIQEIDRRFVEEKQGKYARDMIERTRIIKDNQVRMANLSIIGSHSTNGVAKLHTELLKDDMLHDFYVMYPERFNNKTNGITDRRWLQIANLELSKVLDKAIGTEWRQDPTKLQKLLKHQNDNKVLNQIANAKLKNKERLAKFIEKETGIKVSTDAIFDVQIKRLHAYKRQLLKLMHIVKLYLDIKQGKVASDFQPRVFIFGAKAAPSYYYAKAIIKCINEVANMVNNDPEIGDKLKVVFLEDYRVSLAEKIIPAANISEQISLASKEASGTSNMKLMLNGALTVATLDGANIEIKDYVGEDNIFIFGLTKDEVYDYYNNGNYHSYDYYNNHEEIRRVLNAFVDGTIPNCQAEGQEIFDSLTKYNDEYFVLRDFESYVNIQEMVDRTYGNKRHWNQMSLVNIAYGGMFSSDDTIKRYAEDIWNISPLKDEKHGTYSL
ncbi:glycogen/starch/alpha-glucan phosphorylase [Ligilactobacillus salivarius]|uniref:glycogen/starch/alpha-glucan phosphorylase n=1 Tax=Ligilactobacillus salivarius TaxID=1624 RepID=UPI00136DB2FC|nr:glycogen/starch/alpha-glucan phosphorylase [Ligilactobacillus salivarius]MYV10728.1 glycogen/starch/alpha-glucan phosphorylase [Ligilactobacillus salivarius]